MVAKKKRSVVTPDKLDKEALELALRSQGNAIPLIVATVLRMAIPIATRLAIRFVARRYRKKISEQAINTASAYVGQLTQAIIKRAGVK